MLKKTKNIAICVIASREKNYDFYLNNFWKDAIILTENKFPHIKVFLLFSKSNDKIHNYNNLDFSDKQKNNNIIIDQNRDYNNFFSPMNTNGYIPGILSKRIYAFECLHNKFDIFYNTNCSQIIDIYKFDQYVQNNKINYSGDYVWKNTLRKQIVNYINPKLIPELTGYTGNTFVSGSGFFLNQSEVHHLLKNKGRLRYDIIDDVSIGLMMNDGNLMDKNYRIKINSNDTRDTYYNKILKFKQEHFWNIRLQWINDIQMIQDIYKILKEME